MSLELGGPDKNIIYLNLTKAGTESTNSADVTEDCSVTIKFQPRPLMDNQEDYLCAVTRFTVPLTEVPTILPKRFYIFKCPNDVDAGNVIAGLLGAGIVVVVALAAIGAWARRSAGA